MTDNTTDGTIASWPRQRLADGVAQNMTERLATGRQVRCVTARNDDGSCVHGPRTGRVIQDAAWRAGCRVALGYGRAWCPYALGWVRRFRGFGGMDDGGKSHDPPAFGVSFVVTSCGDATYLNSAGSLALPPEWTMRAPTTC